MPAARMLVKGRVQGVGFRAYVRHEAVRLGLCGWVRNLPGGEVEVLASGDSDTLKRLHERVSEGPALARVNSVDIHYLDEDYDQPFHIR